MPMQKDYDVSGLLDQIATSLFSQFGAPTLRDAGVGILGELYTQFGLTPTDVIGERLQEPHISFPSLSIFFKYSSQAVCFPWFQHPHTCLRSNACTLRSISERLSFVSASLCTVLLHAIQHGLLYHYTFGRPLTETCAAEAHRSDAAHHPCPQRHQQCSDLGGIRTRHTDRHPGSVQCK